MNVLDWSFERLFRRAFVYNILFEDTRVDEAFLDLDEDSRVLAISGAGCGVANHLSANPRRVDAVDINRHHLALTALKVEASRRLRSHQELYELLGRGRHDDPAARVGELAAGLPGWMRRYWRRHHRVFRRSMIQSGVTARMLQAFRELSGIDAAWLRRRIGETVAERQRALEAAIGPVLENPLVRGLVSSPLQLVALGVNYAQRDKIERTEGQRLADYLLVHLKRAATTDIETNWFVWYACAGFYNHDHPDARPPYLREDNHARALEARTEVRYHADNIFDVLARGRARAWTHYTLCDAVDWMPPPAQRRLFDEILRTSEDGARVLYRSVEDDSLIARHGLADRFVLDEEASRLASAEERTKLYRRVNFYDVVH